MECRTLLPSDDAGLGAGSEVPLADTGGPDFSDYDALNLGAFTATDRHAQ